MQLNDIGKIAEQYWLEISNHFSFIELGNFVVMPNHTHGILIIGKPNTSLTTQPTQPTPTKTNKWQKFLQNQGQFQPLSGHTNLWYQNTPDKSMPILHGNHDFMTVLFVMHDHLKPFKIILPTTQRIGKKINLRHKQIEQILEEQLVAQLQRLGIVWCN